MRVSEWRENAILSGWLNQKGTLELRGVVCS